MTRYPSLAECWYLAEYVTSIDAATLIKASRVELADSALHAPQAGFGDTDFYPDVYDKAAVLACRIAWNHPLPDGNKRVGFVCMIEFCLRNGLTWTPPPGDEDGEVSAQMILELAAGRGDEDAINHCSR